MESVSRLIRESGISDVNCKGDGKMKKALVIIFCAGQLTSGAVGAPVLQKQNLPSDTTGIKNIHPQKQLRKEKEQKRKATLQDVKLRHPDFLKNDRPLLFKEKDSLHTKQK